MFKRIKAFLVIIITMFLFGGCCWDEPTPITHNVYMDTRPPAELMIDNIEVPVPPNSETYIGANPINRERILTRQIIMLYSTIGKYKSRMSNITAYHDDMTDTIAKANAIEEERVRKLLEE